MGGIRRRKGRSLIASGRGEERLEKGGRQSELRGVESLALARNEVRVRLRYLGAPRSMNVKVEREKSSKNLKRVVREI